MAYRDTKNVRIDFLDEKTSNDSKVCAWTWNELTDNEKRIFKNILYGAVNDCVINDESQYEKEWNKMQTIYYNLLDLVGYTAIEWREEKKPKEITVKLSVDGEGNVKVIQ